MLAPVFCCPRASTEDAADAAACHPELDEGEDYNREGEINRIVRMARLDDLYTQTIHMSLQEARCVQASS